MSEAIIEAKGLAKRFRVPEREPGLRAAVGALLHPKFREVNAVTPLTFQIFPGERVGLIGSNGAGKTTTLKLLSGLLHPSEGEARVAGFIPWERKPEFLHSISMVLGNKSQMIWDIPPLDTFRVLGEIYNLPATETRRRVNELVEIFEMQDLLTRPVRNLSLGERMKCELVAGLLHHPKVLFLDEPTLGLDQTMQNRLRQYVAEYNRRHGAAVILTSHYMADVIALCPRVILIHKGGILYDGDLGILARKLAPFKLIRVTLQPGNSGGAACFPPGIDLLGMEGDSATFRVGRDDAPEMTARLLAAVPVVDLVVEDPPVEAVIDQIYQEGSV